MIKKLYVIGNGFDIHHKLDTRYSDFGDYLADNDEDLYNLLTEHIDFPDNESDLWSNFEANLANLNTDSILSLATNYLPNYGSDEFRDGDRYDFEYEMERYLRQLTSDLFEHFRDFIEAVKINEESIGEKIRLDRDALFLNFNYTSSLQNLYQIPAKNINYIHNAAHDKSSKIILGHGIDPNELLRKKSEPPPNLSDEELQDWKDQQADQYDYSFDRGEQTIMRYFKDSFKPTQEIIENNSGYFSSLNDITEIVVLGHSVSEVDINYFKKIAESTASDCKWSISYFSNQDITRISAALGGIGIDNARINFIKISDLKINNIQSKLDI
jgi:hypothetical protein